MVWYKGKWWRFAYSKNRAGSIWDHQGGWKHLAFGVWFLNNPRSPCPLGEETLYKQVYHSVLQDCYSHRRSVDVAVRAVKAFGKHRAVSQMQLDTIVEEVSHVPAPRI